MCVGPVGVSGDGNGDGVTQRKNCVCFRLFFYMGMCVALSLQPDCTLGGFEISVFCRTLWFIPVSIDSLL